MTTVEKGENESDQEGDELSPREVRVIQKTGDGVTALVGSPYTASKRKTRS